MPELWEELLYFLQQNVPKGKVTTYGNLSTVFFGGTNSGPAIVAMLNAAGANNPDNCRWTNRVVNARGCHGGGKATVLSSSRPRSSLIYRLRAVVIND